VIRRTVWTCVFWFLVIVLAPWIVDKQGTALVGPAQADPLPDSKVELKPVKWTELAEAVRVQQGKVVVADVWAEY
jgi:hypothetical protein